MSFKQLQINRKLNFTNNIKSIKNVLILGTVRTFCYIYG